MAEHVHDLIVGIEPDGKVYAYCKCEEIHLNAYEIERRLNATERLSAKGARAIINVFPVDALIAYADTLEGD